MKTLFYITIAYLASVLISLITFNIFSFNNRSNVMDKDDFYKLLFLAIIPVFNIFLLLGIIGVVLFGYLIELTENKTK